jgi:hypothetical protein
VVVRMAQEPTKKESLLMGPREGPSHGPGKRPLGYQDPKIGRILCRLLLFTVYQPVPTPRPGARLLVPSCRPTRPARLARWEGHRPRYRKGPSGRSLMAAIRMGPAVGGWPAIWFESERHCRSTGCGRPTPARSHAARSGTSLRGADPPNAEDSSMGEMLDMSLHRERDAMAVDDLTALPAPPTCCGCSP